MTVVSEAITVLLRKCSLPQKSLPSFGDTTYDNITRAALFIAQLMSAAQCRSWFSAFVLHCYKHYNLQDSWCRPGR